MDTLPYKNAAFTIQKGIRDMRVVVPRDEVLQERRQGLEKPSILTQLQADKSAAAQGEKDGKTTPKRDNNVEV